MKKNPEFFQPFMQEEKEPDIENWGFGERFSFHAREIMDKIFFILEEIKTVQ